VGGEQVEELRGDLAQLALRVVRARALRCRDEQGQRCLLADARAHAAAQGSGLRRGNRKCARQRDGLAAVGVQQHLLEQRFLALDVEVERALGDAELGRNVGHLRAAIAGAQEDGGRGAQDRVESIGRNGPGHGGRP